MTRPALLVLEDGTTLHGTGFGAEGETFGEMVFNTGMTGYQETLTDPSYCRQIVAMTAPHVGNTGVNDEDPESGQVWVSGYVVREPARLASVTSLPVMLNAFHDEEFVFGSSWHFAGRFGDPGRFRGEGEFVDVAPGRHMWQTNVVADLASFELPSWAARGAGSRNLKFVLADATMHAHVSEMPAGTYKKGHRHRPDFHVFTVTGHGYSLLWYEGDADFTRIDWRHGVVYAPADQQFHQHFNTAPHPTRYLAVAYGGLRYPFTEERRQHFLGVDKSVSEGGRQIDYADEDPRIRELYEKELAASGLSCLMPPAAGRARR